MTRAEWAAIMREIGLALLVGFFAAFVILSVWAVLA